MKTYQMNRIFGLCLAMALMFTTLPLQAMATFDDSEQTYRASQLVAEFAQVSEQEISTTDLETQVAHDLLLMSEKHFVLNKVSIYDLKDNGEVVYAHQPIDGVLTYINLWEDQNGSVIIHYQEGNIKNTVEYTPDKEIIVDGHKVTIEVNSDLSSAASSIITPYAGVRRYTQDTLPRGTTLSEYSDYGMAKPWNAGSSFLLSSTAKIEFGVSVASLAVDVVASILSQGLSGFWAVVNGAMGAAGTYAIAQKLVQLHPNMKYASFKEHRYAHSKNNVVYRYKHIVWAYPERNYQGGDPWAAKTFYEIVEPT